MTGSLALEIVFARPIEIGTNVIGILLGLNIIFWLLGFVLPVPCFIFAGVVWFKTRGTSAAKPWRQLISQIALVAFAVGIAFWVYVAAEQYRGADFYGTTTSFIGASGSALLIILSGFAEGRVRIWLILGAIGLLAFFGVSTGEAAI